MTRTRWFVDIWDADSDPGLLRGREALALRPTEAPQAPERPERPPAAPDPTTRRDRIAALVLRIENGDLSAVATLRDLLADR